MAAASPAAPSTIAAEAAAVAPKTTPSIPVPFDLSQPPVIEGFNPSSLLIRDETFKEKFMRKFKSNPFVPLGCAATAGALVWGIRAFNKGKTNQSQMMMRARIGAQGFTVIALIFGVLSSWKPKE